MREIICDNFAGGGGASTGIERALGRFVDVAINHNPEALAIHKANHPHTRHLVQNICAVDPRDATQGQPVGLAWFSPDCKHFSKAKGGAPVEKRIRDLAWVVVHWAQMVKPRVICLENVEEFQDWGPLLADGRPCPKSRGLEFLRWVRELRKAGYVVEWKELRACDYGAPTIRKRLFLIARCDGRPIVWPKPTHGPNLIPYRAAATCIDWSLPCPSIFERKRPLAEATLRRIARGVWRYVINAKRPFIVPLTHTGPSNAGNDRCQDIDNPLGTQTAKAEYAIVNPCFCGVGGRAGQSRPRGAEEPFATSTSKPDLAVIAPYFVPRYGERDGQEPRCRSCEEPFPTIVPNGNGAELVSAFLAQHNGGMVGHNATDPLSTVTQSGAQQAVVTSNLLKMRNNCYGQGMDEPLDVISAGGTHFAEVRAFLMAYYGSDQNPELSNPLPTCTTHDRFGLVTVNGIDYQIVDIGMRMLTPRELFRAQGFPEDYVICPDYNGKPLSKTAQTRACGNSVCPPLAEAIVRSNVIMDDVLWPLKRQIHRNKFAVGQGVLL